MFSRKVKTTLKKLGKNNHKLKKHKTQNEIVTK